MDETHGWLKRNGGQRLARVLRRNAAKMDGRTLELANAPEIGEESVAEQTEAENRAGHPGILFHAVRPSVEPAAELDDEALLGLLGEVYAGAPWIDLRRILREVRDPAAPWPETCRFFFNLPASGVLAAVDPRAWAACERTRELQPGERLVLGFDGSHVRDGTALVGCTEDGWLFPVEILERPPDADEEWRIDRRRIHRAIEHMTDTYRVEAIYADPWQWQSELDTWGERWPDTIIVFPTNHTRKMAPAVDRFRSAVVERHLSHDGDPDLARHVLNARLAPAGRDADGRGTYTLEKPGPGRLIDACVAAVLAFEAASQLEPVKPKPRPMITAI